MYRIKNSAARFEPDTPRSETIIKQAPHYASDILCHRSESTVASNPLNAKLFNLNFTHLKLCLADAIHNFNWVKIIQIDEMEVNNDFEINFQHV